VGAPPIKAFLEKLDALKIRGDTERLFNDAVEQAQQYEKWNDPNFKVKDFNDFVDKVNVFVSGPPKFYKAVVDNHITIGEPIGVPILIIFDLIGNTAAGYTLLKWEEFNKAVEVLLNGWRDYLRDDPSSNGTLNKEGWFSDAGLALLESGLGKLTFDQTFESDSKTDPRHYNTWDSFFTRQFKKDVRPIVSQPTKPGAPFYIYNPCESTVFRTAADVRIHDTFWLKSQRYSLYDMLGGDKNPELSKYAKDLDGASVLQSFLAPQDFHRWQSPVNGSVVASKRIAGTYYAVLPDDGAPLDDTDLLPGDPHGSLIRSQPWLSVAATRAVFIIKPEETSPIDLIAFVGVGMAEVSSCALTVPEIPPNASVPIKVGEELGMFHFGGSTYVMVIQPKKGHKVVFQDVFNSPVRPGQHRWIRSVVGQIWEESAL